MGAQESTERTHFGLPSNADLSDRVSNRTRTAVRDDEARVDRDGNAAAALRLGIIYEDGLIESASEDAEQPKPDITRAVRYYRIAADANNVDALCRLAHLYARGRDRSGHGLLRNIAEAKRLYRRAARLQSPEAKNNLGYFHENGVGTRHPKNWKALKYYREAADLGHAQAQCNLANLYLDGTGTEPDAARAVQLYRDAVRGGCVQAMCTLGELLAYGRGPGATGGQQSGGSNHQGGGVLQQDGDSDHDTMDSMNDGEERDLTHGYLTRDAREAHRLLSQAERHEHAGALYTLGKFCEQGLFETPTAASATGQGQSPGGRGGSQGMAGIVVPVSAARARAYYARAAHRGHAKAMMRLAQMLRSGAGGTTDAVEAFRYYEHASCAKEPEAFYQLGVMTSTGSGTAKSASRAQEYFLEAARLGDARAQKALGDIYRSSDGMDRTDRRAYEYYALAAEQGDPVAACRLGMMHMTGAGATRKDGSLEVPQDLSKAAELFEQAAECGNTYAIFQLGMLYAGGKCDRLGGARNPAEAHSKFLLAARKGLAEAHAELAREFMHGERAAGVRQNMAKATEHLKIAADKGHADSMVELGKQLFNRKLYDDAYDYFDLAAKAEHPEAADLRDALVDDRKVSQERENEDVEEKKSEADFDQSETQDANDGMTAKQLRKRLIHWRFSSPSTPKEFAVQFIQAHMDFITEQLSNAWDSEKERLRIQQAQFMLCDSSSDFCCVSAPPSQMTAAARFARKFQRNFVQSLSCEALSVSACVRTYHGGKNAANVTDENSWKDIPLSEMVVEKLGSVVSPLLDQHHVIACAQVRDASLAWEYRTDKKIDDDDEADTIGVAEWTRYEADCWKEIEQRYRAYLPVFEDWMRNHGPSSGRDPPQNTTLLSKRPREGAGPISVCFDVKNPQNHEQVDSQTGERRRIRRHKTPRDVSIALVGVSTSIALVKQGLRTTNVLIRLDKPDTIDHYELNDKLQQHVKDQRGLAIAISASGDSIFIVGIDAGAVNRAQEYVLLMVAHYEEEPRQEGAEETKGNDRVDDASRAEQRLEPNEYWTDRDVWNGERDRRELERVDPGSAEYQEVLRKGRWFKPDGVTPRIPGATDVQIDRVENAPLWRRFSTQVGLLQTELTDAHRIDPSTSTDVNVVYAWHGTGQNLDPHHLLRTTGIDFRYSRQGLYGRGSYFAENPRYSCADMFIHKPIVRHENFNANRPTPYRQFFLVMVARGRERQTRQGESLTANGLATTAAQLSTAPDGFDCVLGNGSITQGGETVNTDMWIVYDRDRSYPEYLVTFKLSVV